MKRSARGFEQVGHFFLSGGCSKGAEALSASPITDPRRPANTSVPPASGKCPAKNLETADAVRAVSRSADGPLLHRNAEHHINRLNQAYVHIGSTVARLEILKRSCQGVTLAAASLSDKAIWFRGAGAIIQEAMATLSEVINPVCPPEPFLDERDEAEDGT